MRKNMIFFANINTKIFVLVVSALTLTSSLYGQKYHLDMIASDDNLESVKYVYNAQHLVTSLEYIDNRDDDHEWHKDSLYYDATGNVTRYSNYIYLNNMWKNNWYIDYTYDANRNLITRTNYSNVNGTFQEQGRYTYTYSSGLLIGYGYYIGQNILMRGTYTYDNFNRLTQVLEEVNANGNWFNESKEVYTYDNSGKCTSYEEYSWDEGRWELDEKNIFTYDAAGNCTKHEVMDDNNQIEDRYTFTYDTSIAISSVYLPAYPENELEWDKFANRPNKCSWDTEINNTLVHVCNYNFTYSNANVGIDDYLNPQKQTVLLAYPNPANDVVSFNVNDLKRVEIYNVNGMKVLSAKDANTIDVSSLPKGIYMVNAYNGTWHTCKLVVE